MDHIKQVAKRLKGLRDAINLSIEDMAEQCGIDTATLAAYESGTTDIPVSFLHKLANTCDVELTALLFGEEPKMSSYYVTRAGKGVKVERTKAYSYQDLAAGFRHRIMAPFIVTVEPTADDKPQTLNSHQGQEFNYVLEGELEISIAGKVFILHPGETHSHHIITETISTVLLCLRNFLTRLHSSPTMTLCVIFTSMFPKISTSVTT